MRYTEQEHKTEVNDVLDVVKTGFLAILSAPYRLVNEISSKIMFLERAVLEKLILTAILLDTGFLLWDCFYYFLAGKMNFVKGFLPLVPKVIVLLVLAGLAYVVYKKFEFPYETVEREVEEPVREESTYTEDPESDPVEPESDLVEEPLVSETVVPSVVAASEQLTFEPELKAEETLSEPVERVEDLPDVVLETAACEELPVEELPDVVVQSMQPSVVEETPVETVEEEDPFADLSKLTMTDLIDEDLNFLALGLETQVSPISVNDLTHMLSDNSLFSSRDDSEVFFDIGIDTARRLASIDESEEDLK